MFTVILWTEGGGRDELLIPTFRMANMIHSVATRHKVSCLVIAPGTDLEWLASVPCARVIQ